MSRILNVHPETPQRRLLQQAAAAIRDGAVIAYPTDSSYALGCHMGDKKALDRIRAIRRLGDNHNFTLVCRDLSELGTYAQVNTTAYRLLKAMTPGPYTFVLKATRDVPRRLQHPKRKTIGLRVPAHPVVHGLVEALGEPLMSVTLVLPGEELPMTDPEQIAETLYHQVDLVLDAGLGGMDPTTVIDLTEDVPRVLRQGVGPVPDFLQR